MHNSMPSGPSRRLCPRRRADRFANRRLAARARRNGRVAATGSTCCCSTLTTSSRSTMHTVMLRDAVLQRTAGCVASAIAEYGTPQAASAGRSLLPGVVVDDRDAMPGLVARTLDAIRQANWDDWRWPAGPAPASAGPRRRSMRASMRRSRRRIAGWHDAKHAGRNQARADRPRDCLPAQPACVSRMSRRWRSTADTAAIPVAT